MSYSGFLVITTLDQKVSIFGPFEEQQLAAEQAESATAQGRAREAYVVPVIQAFNESSRPWANPDNTGSLFVHNTLNAQTNDAPAALNPDAGKEQPIAKSEAEANVPPPTETLQGNIQQGSQDGNPSTVGENEPGSQQAQEQANSTQGVGETTPTPGSAEASNAADSPEVAAQAPGKATARSGTAPSKPIKL